MMECSQPPPLRDDALSDALDGIAAPEVLAHLAGCAACAERLDAARAVEERLTGTLYRWDCPPPDRLAEYASTRLPPGTASALAEHLAVCALCSRELEDFKQFQIAEPPASDPPPVLPPAQPHPGILFAQIVAGAGAVLRGAGPEPIMAEANGVTIFLDLQPRPDGRAALQGQLVANDQDVWESALVEIRQAGALVATAIVDDLGSFACEALPPGVFDLRIAAPNGRMLVLADVAATL